jgi:hypothetical protein
VTTLKTIEVGTLFPVSCVQLRGKSAENAIMQRYLFLLMFVPLTAGAYNSLRGGIFKKVAGSTGSRLEYLLAKTDIYAAVIVIVCALVCALAGVVVAVSRGEADAPLVCWPIAISGLLCRSTLPLSDVQYGQIDVIQATSGAGRQLGPDANAPLHSSP